GRRRAHPAGRLPGTPTVAGGTRGGRACGSAEGLGWPSGPVRPWAVGPAAPPSRSLSGIRPSGAFDSGVAPRPLLNPAPAPFPGLAPGRLHHGWARGGSGARAHTRQALSGPLGTPTAAPPDAGVLLLRGPGPAGRRSGNASTGPPGRRPAVPVAPWAADPPAGGRGGAAGPRGTGGRRGRAGRRR